MEDTKTDNQTKEKVKERSFRATWSSALEPFRFTQVSNLFLENYHKLGVTAAEAMFLIHLFMYKWSVDDPFPSLDTIAKFMGKSHDTVQRHARSLERKGFLKRKYRKKNTSHYNLNPLIDILETIIPFKNLSKEGMQNALIPYAKLHTKLHPLSREYDSKMPSIGDTIKARSS